MKNIADNTSLSTFTDRQRRLDKAFGRAQNGLFRLLTAPVNKKKIPLYENYSFENKETFFKGTGGVSEGSGWSGGYASASVIPKVWRCNLNGARDENGFCLNKAYPTGGYQTYVSKLYTDQRMNTLVLSHNGKDFLIFISVDGAGISADTTAKMRKAVLAALLPLGIKKENILGCNVSATHCHAGLDTLGMSVGELVKNKFKPYPENGRSLAPDMENSLVECAAATAAEAFKKLENGTLSFFETGEADGVTDKFKCGARVKNTFSCLLFESAGGEKTLLTNIGAHPVSYGAWNKNSMMCTDYPYFMWLALREKGINLVFTQSAQAAVSSPSAPCENDAEAKKYADEFIKAHSLTKNEWTLRYGYAYSEQWYNSLEKSLESHMRRGVMLAYFVLQSIEKAERLAPVLNVKNRESLVRFDYGVMQLACVAGLLGGSPVRIKNSPCPYGTMTETNYIEIGNSVVMLTAPGELSPAFVLGSAENYDGEYFWNGKTSISGEEWQHQPIKNTALGGAADKKFIMAGITNNELGYILPDNFAFSSMLGAALFYKANSGDMFNCMMLTPGKTSASLLTEQYEALIRDINNKA